MTDHEKMLFKITLKQFAIALISQRISTAKLAIDQAQQAANQEEKSSAGDKYETARAMSHLEKEMHTRQLAEQVKELATLHAIDVNAVYSTAKAGAFIKCSEVSFFIAAGLGKQSIEGHTVLFLSAQAPLSRILQGKKAGDSFLFNTMPISIEEVY